MNPPLQPPGPPSPYERDPHEPAPGAKWALVAEAFEAAVRSGKFSEAIDLVKADMTPGNTFEHPYELAFRPTAAELCALDMVARGHDMRADADGSTMFFWHTLNARAFRVDHLPPEWQEKITHGLALVAAREVLAEARLEHPMDGGKIAHLESVVSLLGGTP